MKAASRTPILTEQTFDNYTNEAIRVIVRHLLSLRLSLSFSLQQCGGFFPRLAARDGIA